jgi:oxamate amidohydrolase
MLNTPRSRNGMVTSPHHLASQAGLQILRDGGTAVEAAVATAAVLAVVYPHMNGLGGDNFWLIATPGNVPIGIDACGASSGSAEYSLYRERGLSKIPQRGPLSANTVAGAVSGWHAALEATAAWQRPLPLRRLLREAIGYANDGFAVTASQSELTAAKRAELADVPGFSQTYLNKGDAPREGELMRFPMLARTLTRLADEGLDSFYRGKLARLIADDLAKVGALITADDLSEHRALVQAPLSVHVKGAQLFNMPPPTQGLASLTILAVFDRLGIPLAEGFSYIHGMVEATKQAFRVRDREICDPRYMATEASAFLAEQRLDEMANRIDSKFSAPWPAPASGGDTVWLGVTDREGRSVSMIQSIFFEFGSGVVLPETGITWQNRGCSFALDEESRNRLRPEVPPEFRLPRVDGYH